VWIEVEVKRWWQGKPVRARARIPKHS